MAEVVPNTQQEFWRPPVPLPAADPVVIPDSVSAMAEACPSCATEFMIGARFCHACGANRPQTNILAPSPDLSLLFTQKLAAVRSAAIGLSAPKNWPRYWRKLSFPAWLRYLHFHEIQRRIGLPTASLIAFFVGLGCVAGAIGIGLVYKASTLDEFQAVQMWRMEWLLAATASFVAGILLKKPGSGDNE